MERRVLAGGVGGSGEGGNNRNPTSSLHHVQAGMIGSSGPIMNHADPTEENQLK